jgi:hypothetical protein
LPIIRPMGLGGGGQLFCPRISPHDPNLVFVACDMSGWYRSDNMFLSEDRRWDRNWTMLEQRLVRGSIHFSVAFDPDADKRVMGFNSTEGLMESIDGDHNYIYLCAADIQQSRGGGGLYKLDLGQYQPGAAGANGWNQLPVPFKSKNYWDTLQAFAPTFFEGLLFVTSTSHGMWCSADEQEWVEWPLLKFLRPQRMVARHRDPQYAVQQFFVTTFGGGAWEMVRQCHFVVDRNSFSREEYEAVKGSNPSAVFEDAFFVVFDGFLPIEVTGIAKPTRAQVMGAAPNVSAKYNVSLQPAQGIRIKANKLLLEDENLPPDVPQRFVFSCAVEFTSDADFPPVGDPTGVRSLVYEVTKGSVRNAWPFSLTTKPAPYMTDGQTPWLSTDLRVFKVGEGEAPAWGGPQFPVIPRSPPSQTAIETAASDCIKNILSNMNDALFESIKGGADQEVLPLGRLEGGKRVFGFAVARVRYRGQTQPANDVRVFFRLFKTASTAFNYDEATSYRRAPSPADVPRLGWRGTPQGNEIVTIPCFAERRVDTAATSMDQQTDPINEKTLDPAGASERQAFYGCWLDFNQSTPRFPVNPMNDGPYSGTLESIQTLVKGQHQCLVAEIHFPPDPRVEDFGGDPENVPPSPDGGPKDRDPAAPTVTGFGPQGRNVPPGANVRATFSEDMRADTINGNTVFLRRRGSATKVAANVTYDAGGRAAVLNPTRNLRQAVTYVATVKGGIGGVKDLAGNALLDDKVWRFRVRP